MAGKSIYDLTPIGVNLTSDDPFVVQDGVGGAFKKIDYGDLITDLSPYFKPDSVQIIRSLEDWKEKAGYDVGEDAILLQSNVVYIIDAPIFAPISVGDTRLKLTAGAWHSIQPIQGGHPFNSFISYTGTGSMIYDDNSITGGASLLLGFIGINAPNGQVYNFPDSGERRGSLIWQQPTFHLSTAYLGEVKNFDFVTSLTGLIMEGCGDGLEMVNNNTTTLTTPQWTNGADTGGDAFRFLAGNIGKIISSGGNYTPKSTESIFNINLGSIIDVGSISAAVYKNSEGGSFFNAGGLDQTHPKLKVSGINNQSDSITTSSMWLQGNAVATVIRNLNEWRTIAGITTSGGLERAEMSNDSEITFKNLAEVKGSVDVNLGVSVVGGGTKDLEFAVFKSTGDTGAITAFTDSTVEAGVKTRVTSAGHPLANGEYIKIIGTTNYNDDWVVSNVSGDFYDIEIVFIADDATGTWFEMALVTGSIMPRQTAAISGSLPTKANLSVIDGDIIDIRGRNTTDTNNILVTTLQLSTNLK